MTSGDWARVRALVEEALDLPAAERADHLERAAGGDPELVDAARRLLSEIEGSEGFLEPPGSLEEAVAAALTPGAGEPAGEYSATLEADTRVGAYRVRSVLASGGMGTVYLAEQERPRRRVALKMLRAGRATPQTLRRFRVEAEILAHLRHPNVAQVYEAGVHVEGSGALRREVPWFALEHIEGARDLVRHARAEGLDLGRALALFEKVCAAVHHAHQRGVIHRDLKPGNVLVGADGEPKVIDFGVARATRRPGDAAGATGAAAASLVTRAGEIVGTLGYMAPEQLDGDPARVDVRCDVYALGMLLYELVCGAPPYRLASASLSAAEEIVRHRPPARPRSLRPDLPVELEWILLKALEKEPERRYASADELLRDLVRLRRHEAVAAGPPSTAYRLRKLARRHRAALATAVAALAALVLWLVHSDRLRVAAEREAERARYVNELLRDTLVLGDPYLHAEGGQADLRVAELLRIKADQVAADFAAFPELAAELRAEIGAALFDLGDFDAAVEHLAVAAELHAGRLGTGHADTLAVESSLARARAASGDLAGAEAAQRALAARLADRADVEPELVLGTALDLARTLSLGGRHAEAEQRARAALTAAEAELGGDAPTAVRGRRALAEILLAAGRPGEAEPLLRSAHAALAAGSRADAPVALLAEQRLGLCLWKLGRLADARARLAGVVERQERVLGPDHFSTLESRSYLASVLHALSRRGEAEALVRENLVRRRRRYGDAAAGLASDRCDLALLLLQRGALAEAQAQCEQALAQLAARAARGARGDERDRAELRRCQRALAEVCYARGAFEEALALLERFDTEEGRRDADLAAWRARELRARLAVELEGALEPYRALVADLRRELGPAHFLALDAARKLVGALAQAGRTDEALALADRTAELATEAARGAPTDAARLELFRIEGERAELLALAGRRDAAEEGLRAFLAETRDELGPAHLVRLAVVPRYAALLRERGALDEAEACLVDAAEQVEAAHGAGHELALELSLERARVQLDGDRFREAAALLHAVAVTGVGQLGADHPVNAHAVAWLDRTLDAADRRMDPESGDWSKLPNELDYYYEEIARAARAAGEESSAVYRAVLALRGGIFELFGDFEGAVALYAEALERGAEVLAPDSVELYRLRLSTAAALRRAGRADEAREACAELVRIDGEHGRAPLELRALLSRERARLLAADGRPDEAEAVLVEGRRLLEAAGPELAPLLELHRAQTARLRRAWGRGEAAAALER